jgi:hypothetical protein
MFKFIKLWLLNRQYNKLLGSYAKAVKVQEAWLQSRALPFCRHCYGKGHVGFNLNTGLYAPCKCANRNDIKRMRRAMKNFKPSAANQHVTEGAGVE